MVIVRADPKFLRNLDFRFLKPCYVQLVVTLLGAKTDFYVFGLNVLAKKLSAEES